MYAQIIRISLKPDQVEEFRELYEEYIIPELAGQEGYKNFYLLIDRENARAISFTLWSDRGAAEKSEEVNLYLEQRAAYPLYSAPPDREGYEIPVWK
jgi:quinol monooxygenase YgiN